MTDEPPSLDLTQIPFPSDRLTLGHLRRRYPDLFDKSEAMAGALFDKDEITGELGAMISCERSYAAVIFRAVMTGQVPNQAAVASLFEGMVGGEDDRLIKDYQRYGLAGGPFEAREMLRELKNTVFTYAQPLLGRDGR